MTGPNVKRITPKPHHRFAVVVDATLWKLANTARKRTWPRLVEELLALIALDTSIEAIVNTALDLLCHLESELRSEYEGTKQLKPKLDELKTKREYLVKVKAGLIR